MQDALEYVNCNLCGNSKTTLLFIKDGYRHVRCDSCGLIYVNPRLKNSKETLDSFYGSNANSESLIKGLLDRDYSVKRQKIFYAELKKMERYRKLNKVLDIGCSFGGFLNATKNCGWDAKGIEVVYEVGKYGKELYGLDIFFGTLEEAQLKPSSFDVIRLNNVIEHIYYPAEFLSNVSMLLRKGGLLTVSTTNYDSFSVLICGKEWIYFDGQHHICLFTPATLKKLLDKNGFTTILLNTKGIHVRVKDNVLRNPVKKILFKLSEKVLSQFIPFTKKGHRLRAWAEKR